MANDITLSTPIDQLENNILNETDIDELNTIIDIFNVNLKKKDIVRSGKLSEVQDKVVQQIYDRVEKRGDELSTADLINLHKVVQDTIIKTDTTLNEVKVPNIQINQQVNINSTPEFDRDSRARILDVVNDILFKASNTTDEDKFIEANFEEEDAVTE